MRLSLCTLALAGLAAIPGGASATAIQLTSTSVPYTQNFDTLATTGTSSLLPNGWEFFESGTAANSTYTSGANDSAAGDTYSFGTGSGTDRSFGTLRDTSLTSIIGAEFQNKTGKALSALTISYTGEEWYSSVNADRLDFQYAVAPATTSVGDTAVTWSDLDLLDFTEPKTVPLARLAGAVNGNNNTYSTDITLTVLLPQALQNNATFWIRWVDFDVNGNDAGLGIDNFSIVPEPTGAIALFIGCSALLCRPRTVGRLR